MDIWSAAPGVATFVGSTAAIAVGFAVGWRRVRPHMKQLERFTKDWFGEDEEPGVMSRLGKLEGAFSAAHDSQAAIARRLDVQDARLHLVEAAVLPPPPRLFRGPAA